MTYDGPGQRPSPAAVMPGGSGIAMVGIGSAMALRRIGEVIETGSSAPVQRGFEHPPANLGA